MASETSGGERARGYHLEIFLICFAALLLEVSYTRVVSYKLFYYYTYLVIGLALLGIGSGSVVTSVSRRLRQASTDGIMMVGSLLGSASVIVGYLIVSRLPISSLAIWEYGTGTSIGNLRFGVVRNTRLPTRSASDTKSRCRARSPTCSITAFEKTMSNAPSAKGRAHASPCT